MAVTMTSRAGESSVSVDIPFHKHCQKTVLSVSGIPSGNGATWSTISDLSEKLNYFPENWLEKYFMSNHNITEDLASVLELINGVYGKISEISPIKQVSFYDVDNNIIGTYVPDKNGQISPKLGRKINLSIEGEQISFSTLTGVGYDVSSEITSITLPKHTLQVISGGSTVDSVGVVMENDFDISIPLDSNLVHKTGDETIDGDKTFTGTTTLNGTSTKLSESPLPTASGHEVVDAAWVKNMYLEMFNQIYPVGSVYISTTGSIPTTFNGTWEQLATGRTLWNVDPNVTETGTKIEAGLPNITGDIGTIGNNGSITGAFEVKGEGGLILNENGEPSIQCDFNASRCSNIYGSSNTVQPPAIAVTMWKRTS